MFKYIQKGHTVNHLNRIYVYRLYIGNIQPTKVQTYITICRKYNHIHITIGTQFNRFVSKTYAQL